MKKTILVFFLLFGMMSYSQENATLGIGLESLTFNKGTIDVEVLTKIIMKKQKELKNEALKRFMFKMFPESDYTTRFYVQNCLNILLNEKNPQVIEKEILELTTNYAVALGVTQAVVKMDNAIFKPHKVVNGKTELSKKNKHVDHQRIMSEIDNNEVIKTYHTTIKEIHKANKEIDSLFELYKKAKKNKESINKSKKDVENKIKAQENLEKKLNKIKRKLLRNNVNPNDTIELYENSNELTFGEKLDFISLTLSENVLLRKKGFFKNKIDYREEQGYFFTKEDDETIINTINEKINPYIENYDIIKNFIETTGIKDFKNINDALTNAYLNQLDLDIEFGSFITNGPLNDNLKSELEQLKSVLQLKSDYIKLSALKGTIIMDDISKIKTISSIPLLEEINTLEDTKSLPVFNPLEQLKKSLDDVKKSYDDVKKLNNTIENYNQTLKNIASINLFKTLQPDNLHPIVITAKDKMVPEKDLTIKMDEIKKEIENIYKIKAIVTPNPADQNSKIKEINNTISRINSTLKALNDDLKTIKINFIVNDDFKENIRSLDGLKIIEITTLLDLQIDDVQKNISKSSVFFTVFIDHLLKKIENDSVIPNLTTQKEVIYNKELSELIATVYERLSYFKTTNNYTISDINYLEKDLLPKLVGLKYNDQTANQTFYNSLISGIKNLTPLLKIRILTTKNLNISIENYSELISLFEFIGNLDKLDRAQTYASIVDLIQKNSEAITQVLPDGEFKESYKLFINGVKKYTLINPNAEKEYVEIDVVSFLNDLQQYYDRKNPSKFSLYLTVGLNQNVFVNKFKLPESDEVLNNIGFASEKLGVKLKLHDFRKVRGYENVIKSDVYLNQRAPFINEWFVTAYGSGLLYSLANTTTNTNFNFPHFGVSTGFRFYNALDFNVMLGLPFVKNEKFGNNGFIGIAFDIPLGEYLEALGNK